MEQHQQGRTINHSTKSKWLFIECSGVVAIDIGSVPFLAKDLEMMIAYLKFVTLKTHITLKGNFYLFSGNKF